jgi:abhydrolase domain-containing protein 2
MIVHFRLGSTEEYGVMVDRIRERYPATHCIAVGFSMGGNVVTKYMGESKVNQQKVLCAMSCCQGYDAAQ